MSTKKKTVEGSNLFALGTDFHRFQEKGVPTWCGRHNNRRAQKCFECKTFGCWSTKYTREERSQALKENTLLRAINMDIYKVADDEIGHDEPDPFQNLKEVAVDLAYLSEHQYSNAENEYEDEDGKMLFRKLSYVGTEEYCLYLF